MIPLDEAYEHISDPVNFVKNFACMQQFRVWCEQGSINDLKHTLKAFEKSDILLRGFGLDI